jgi:hypothetical protein
MIRPVVICVMYPDLARYLGRFVLKLFSSSTFCSQVVLKFGIVNRSSVRASAGKADWFRLLNQTANLGLDGVKVRSPGRMCLCRLTGI